ncbi:MAG: 30S ribosomal protein S16 [SAR324 cluster bacterium]|uniref:Small ribosomal subunit protein bS16 n=1 Tax=SAR324 cluster bacterium TaxID=2024889 RepID=A0A7X9IJW9_9DELT|nr:30S ribosomal protein S16 [SAR324 cluster bacterium]
MSVMLRLARHGQKKRPFYRIVAASKQARRDGRFIEIVGNYDPLSNPPAVTLKEDRIRYWVGVGAKATASVQTLIKKNIPNLLEDREAHKKQKIIAARKARKARLSAKGESKPTTKTKKSTKAAKPKSTATKTKKEK